MILNPHFFLARTFRNLDDLNDQLGRWVNGVANPRAHATTRRVVNEAFAEERPHLRPLPWTLTHAGLSAAHAALACSAAAWPRRWRLCRQAQRPLAS